MTDSRRGRSCVPSTDRRFDTCAAGDRLFFFTYGPLGAHEITLWVSDGTPEGTVGNLARFYNGDGFTIGPESCAALGDRLLFPGRDFEHGYEFWISDGTREGTGRFASSAFPPTDDRLFFTGHDLEHGRELWVNDGTPQGTRLLTELVPANGSLDPSSLTGLGDRLFFSADGSKDGRDLWVIRLPGLGGGFHRGDPNESGTSDISDGIVIFGHLFLGSPETLSCAESADANNDGAIEISDAIYLLNWLFLGGPSPDAPGPTDMPCGLDPDPPGSAGNLGCGSYDDCF